MSVSISSGDSRQAHSTPAPHTRHLDHLIDIQDGCPFTAVPEPARSDYIDGRMPESKFRLLFTMLSHAANFKIKRAYLENRFSAHTLTKYLKQLEDEGYIRKDRVPLAHGGFENVYHTNRVGFWKKQPAIDPALEQGSDHAPEHCRPSCNTAPIEGRSVEGRSEQCLNEKKENENKTPNQMNDDSKTRMDIPDAGHHPSGKVDPSIVEYGIKLQGLFRDQGHYVKYGEVNTWLVKMFQKYGPDEMDQFIQFTKAEHARIWMKCGERPPLFSMKAYLSAFAIWIGSEQRDLWKNPADLSADDFHFDEASV